MDKFQKLVNNSFLFRLFLVAKLPMAFIAGIRVNELTNEKAIVRIKYKWLTQNPFKSMYFACQAMAAEMSTGLLVMNYTYQSNPTVSMLIVKNKAEYYKKATGKITFTCNDGNHIAEIIEKCKHSGEGISIDLKSIGIDETGDKVSEFTFTWSLKAKLK
ncbi:MAG: DUF4442 domain-containing protein [Bacteroidia bacterium]|nr:DUF4442 domain-containing protein [Bacteroidia bacterium]